MISRAAFDTLERAKHWTAFHVAQTIYATKLCVPRRANYKHTINTHVTAWAQAATWLTFLSVSPSLDFIGVGADVDAGVDVGAGADVFFFFFFFFNNQ